MLIEEGADKLLFRSKINALGAPALSFVFFLLPCGFAAVSPLLSRLFIFSVLTLWMLLLVPFLEGLSLLLLGSHNGPRLL
jgi:hypothetical protein